jgi:predicted  nucleic acid-binding Zn-ribbon protein
MAADLAYASVDALADVSDEAEVRALETQVDYLQRETASLSARLQHSEGVESKLAARREVLRTNTTRLFAAAKTLIDERDATLRTLRMAESDPKRSRQPRVSTLAPPTPSVANAPPSLPPRPVRPTPPFPHR